MIEPPKIQDFEQLIEPHLKESKVLAYQSRFLTKPGDNYGSTMLGVTILLENEDKSQENLEVVAKIPPMSKIFRELFCIEETVLRENAFYIHIKPALKLFQQEMQVPKDEIISVFAKCYGARASLNQNTEKADENAVLILENLIDRGYLVGDRRSGFNYDTTLVILENLAKFHAVPIALRKMKPEIFETEIRPFTKRYNIEKSMSEEMTTQMIDEIMAEIQKIPEITDEIANKCRHAIDIYREYMSTKDECADGLFTTLGHFDFWVNNMLVYYDDYGKPKKLKIVDFQVSQYESCVHDLIFFLFSSVENDLIKNKLTEFIKYYFDKFYKCLQQMRMDTSEYSYDSFLNEINRLAPYQFGHILIMSRVLFVVNKAKNFEELDLDGFSNKLGSDFYEKLKNVIFMFIERNWI